MYERVCMYIEIIFMYILYILGDEQIVDGKLGTVVNSDVKRKHLGKWCQYRPSPSYTVCVYVHVFCV